ncbi:replication restart helicase PriA [Marinifilum caeruleilacunae]|uniref:Replication restart protein PriA n=1 Tax=Marinifilum caeruleilacunae TaxID=2499076 RepID=A0ABX1WRN9_9BACT|nr:primosomal protein N' [Marinifilum caeruleilacunae]NOU58753.1 primosomal protein N' [Marinifilum caeruleilacunae]
MNNHPKFADIILPLPLAGVFTYSIPGELQTELAIGKRVVVPLGSKKMYTGIVQSLHSNAPDDYQTKDILSCLDHFPIINHIQLKFWDWISQYYQAVLGDVYKAAVPSGLKLESQTKITLNEAFMAEKALSKSEDQILDILGNSKDVSIASLNQATGLKNTLPQIKSLLEKGAVFVEEQISSNYKEKKQEYVCLHSDFSEEQIGDILDGLKRAKKQQELLYSYLNLSKHYFEDIPEKVSSNDLLQASNCSRAILKSLVEKNILKFYFEKLDRLDLSETPLRGLKQLNQHQEKAIHEIRENFEEQNCVLLHGVTSSGKTEIYIHLIEEQIKQGNQVLYLLPEIALTTQIINRLKSVFGNKVGVYHSKFNDAERVEIYNNVLENKSDKAYQVILGVRSSVFLPFSKLGLIIVDEEHENTYKQFDPSPRYHARDAALYLANLHGAKTLLGTATPAVESYYNAQTGKYGLVELFKRHQEIEMPEIIVADIKEARRKKMMKSIFSPELMAHMTESLENKEQIILFQNRRGYAPYLECKSCGWVPHCPNCSVSLTYHRHNNLLVCHYCGHGMAPPNNCDHCRSTGMEDRGFGTEKIEEELLSYFPEARVGRMDLDTTRKKNAYEKLIYKFEKQELDILVGTQMVSKGLDFDHVGLVGILNADSMLNYPDFRAYERSFQMMAQVSGRAGRKKKRGKVLIQTYTPDHEIIKNVVKNDYFEMYSSQLSERKEYIYPPFYRLINISLKHKNQRLVNEAANYLAQSLRKIFGIRVFGPQSPVINRIQNSFIVNILLKIEKKSSPAKAKWILNQQANFLKEIEKFKSIQIHFDVDPM